MPNILICDDEADIVNALKIYLSDPDWTLFTAFTGREALSVISRQEIHLVLLDIMMPEMDGITAMERIRQESNVPIILLTAKSEDTDKILGLGAGADDYITKPFNPLEVIARVRSQLRRYLKLGSAVPEPETLCVGSLELSEKDKCFRLDGEEITLTPKEYEILRLLMSHPGQVFSPAEIFRKVWHEEPLGAENNVAVHIRHLREKIEIDPSEPRYIKVIFGHGYKLEKGVRSCSIFSVPVRASSCCFWAAPRQLSFFSISSWGCFGAARPLRRKATGRSRNYPGISCRRTRRPC